jgi:hypothetical protein
MPLGFPFAAVEDAANAASVEVLPPSSTFLCGVVSGGRYDEEFFCGVDSLMLLELGGAFCDDSSFSFSSHLVPPTAS